MNKRKITPEEFKKWAGRCPDDALVYDLMAGAFLAFERMIRRIDRDCGLDAAAGDVAIGFKQYAAHLQAIHSIAKGGRIQDTVEIDAQYGKSAKEFLECQIREFARAFTEFVYGEDGERARS